MSRQRSRSLPQSADPTVCCFCGFSEDDEIEYGKLLTQNGIVTHYYCLLLSSNMEQNGNDDEGILGFMHSDIQKELRRGKRLSCFYCKKMGATLGCCNTRCKRVFHLPCGLQAGSLHQFFGEFRSYCVRHRLNQQIDDHIKQEAAAAGAVTCYICYEEVNPQNSIRTLWAPCCRKNAWFHRKCVQHLALSAGYFFKCPLCNNKQEFQKAMLEHGIYIPHQDASWELVPNAFQELLHRHNRCDADKCLCPKGRTHTGVNAKWELVLCRLCGSQGIHKACGHLKWASSAWECAECVGMLKKSDRTSLPVIGGIVKITNKISEDGSSSDSEISVGGNPSPPPIIRQHDSPPPVISPMRLRPGPKSFKLQQVERNVKSMESATISTPHTSLPMNIDISAYIRTENSTNTIWNEKCNDQLLHVKDSPVERGSLSTECTFSKATSIGAFNSNDLPQSIEMVLENSSGKTGIAISPRTDALLESFQAKPTDPNCRMAEVIVIDSDDEVEIISEQPKPNVLTTIDGTKIEIYSLSQSTVESQNIESDANVDEPKYFEQSNPQLNRLGLITVNAAPTLTTTTKNKSNVSKLGVTGGKSCANKIVITGKVLQNENNSNLILLNKDTKNEPMMNLKITNVTSLRLEDFANTSQELEESKNLNSRAIIAAREVRSGLFPHDQQQLQLVEIGNPTIGQKQHSNIFQLNTATSMESNVKRKSEGYTVEKNLSNLSNSAAIEQYKRARIGVSENCTILPQRDSTNANIPWNANANESSGTIPVFVTSVPMTCSENENKFTQSKKPLQGSLSESQNSSINGIRLIHNADIHGLNGSCIHPSGTIITSSVRTKTNNDTNYGFVTSNKNIQIRSYGNPANILEARKTYIAVHPQLTMQNSVQKAAASNTNIHSVSQSNLQHLLNSPSNLLENSSPLVKLQTLTEQVSSSSERLALESHGNTQASEYVNRGIKRQNESRQINQTNSPLLNGTLGKGVPKNRTNMPTGNNEYQPDIDQISKTDNRVTQLTDGYSINSVCDGDAGSSPVAEAGFTHQAASECPVASTREPVISKYWSKSTTKAERGAADNTSISTRVRTTHLPQTSLSTSGKYCDRSRLISRKVPLQNLKFRILDSNIVQILLSDNATVKININADNQRNSRRRARLRSSYEKQRSYFSPKRRPKSESLQFSPDEKSEDTGIFEGCISESSNPQYFKNLTVSPKKLVSPKRSLNNCRLSERKLDIDGVKKTATMITNNKTEGSCSSEENCNSERKISDAHSNDTLSISSDENYYGAKENKPLVFASFKNDEKSYFCAQQVSNEWFFKSLWNKGDNIVATEKCQRSNENLEKTSVKTVKNTGDTRRLSSVDFCCNVLYRSLNKYEMKSSIGLNDVPKCFFRDNHNSSELNPPVNCYNNFKKFIDCNSKLMNYEHCNLDANVQDLLKSSCNNIAHSRIDENNESLRNMNAVKSDKLITRDNSRSNNSEDQIININLNSNTSHMLGGKSMNRNITRDSCIETEKQSVDLTDRIGFNGSENASNYDFSICEPFNFKVKIDLNKIQTLIDNKPCLFKKRKWAKSKEDENAIASLPRTYNSSRSHSSLLNCTAQISDCVDNITNTQVEKKLKYDPDLLKENSKS